MTVEDLRPSIRETLTDLSWGQIAVLLTVGVLALVWVIGLAFEDSVASSLVTGAVLNRSLRLASPIALAAIGGLYAEKSGVFNIGLEGFLIFGAFSAVAAVWFLSGGEAISQVDIWASVLVAILVTTLLAAVFALFTIRYKADQIVAGLAVWFMGLGFAPFGAIVLWDRVNSPRLDRIDSLSLFGSSVSPMIFITLAVVVLSWVVFYYTRVGYWIQAAGENPEALDTAGVNVNRVRYGAVIFSGAICGLGGAALSVGFSAGFVGRGVTMVNGRGWIAITAYLFANYNPITTFLAALLFGGVDALQVQLQTLGVAVPARITGLFPFVAVLVALTFFGKTRMPSKAGEPYETEQE